MKDERLRMMKPVVYSPFYSKWYPLRPRIEKYTIVDTIPKLRKLAKKAKTKTEFAFDTETNGLRAYGPDKNFRCVCITISWGPRDNYYIPLAHLRDEDIDRNLDLSVARPLLNKILGRKDVRLIGHNIKFDMHVLARIGVYVKTIDLFDTMVGVWLCDENTPNGLKESSKIKMDIDQTHFADAVATVPKEVKKRFGLKPNSKATYDLVLIDEGAPYALDDSYFTWELYLGLLEELEHEEMDKIFYKHYMPFIWTLYHMEERGITVDVDKLRHMGVDMDKDLEDLMYQMVEIAGIQFNPSSQQLGELLFGYVKEDKLNEKTGKITKANPNWDIIKRSFKFRIISTTPKGAPQVNNDVLWKLSRLEYKKSKRKQQGVEFVKLLMSYNKIKKLKSAFVDGLLDQIYDDGKAHPSYNIIGTDTGRLSCTSPNLQQLPKAEEEDQYQIRSVFIGSLDKSTGKRKKLIACDYANLEMRVLAHFCVQRNMPIALEDGSSIEMGSLVQKCDNSRKVKSYNFDTGKIEAQPITNFWKNGKSNLYDTPQYRGTHDDWLRIVNDGDYSRLVVTDDHEIFTPRGKVRAKNLHEGDTMYYNAPEFSDDLKELVVGITLGDSNFKDKWSGLVFYHADSQREYLDWKKSLLKDYVGEVFEDTTVNKIYLKANPFILKLKECYTQGKDNSHKLINVDIVKHMSVKSLAVWYLDDGCFSHDDRCCSMSGYSLTIARKNISLDVVKALNNKFNFNFRLTSTGISLSGSYFNKFLRAIAPYCPKCMNYKFPHFLKDLVGTYIWNTAHRDVTEVKIVSIERVQKGDPLFKKSLIQSGYDLEVFGNHNYFANNILVSNSKDKNLIDMFLSGADTHGATAVNMFNLDCEPNEVKKKYHHLRQAAKIINFMLMYGGGRFRLYTALRDDQSSPIDLGSEEYVTLYAKQIAEFKRNFRGRKVPSDGEIVAQIYIDRYFDSYKGVAEFIKREKRYAHRHGYVYTLKRRKRRIPDINSDNFGTVGYCERVSVNAPIQGSAADITSSAQNRVDLDDFFIEHGALLLLQVHDELVMECPEEHVEVVTKRLQELMAHPFGDNIELNLPLRADADSGDSYQDAK